MHFYFGSQWSSIGRQNPDAQTNRICTDSVQPALQDNHRELARIKIEQMAIRQDSRGQAEETVSQFSN